MKKQNFFTFICSTCILSSIIILTTYSCKNKESDQKEDVTKPAVTIMSNGLDPLLLTSQMNNDEQLQVFGLRNREGLPEKLTDIIYINQNDTNYYHFDENEKLSHVIASNGTNFHFNWTTETAAVVTVITNDGENELSTLIEFDKQKSNSTQKVTNHFTPRNLTQRIKFSSQTINPNQPVNRNNVQQSSITVLQCNEPAEVSSVFLNAKTTDGKALGILVGQKESKGNWTVNIPSGLAPKTNLADICRNLASVLSAGCIATKLPALDLFCSSLATALASSGIGATVAGQVFVACEGVVRGFTLMCMLLTETAVEGSNSLIDYLCDQPTLDRDLTKDLVLTAWTPALPYNIVSEPVTLIEGQNAPNFILNLTNQTQVKNFSIYPYNPKAGYDYTALVEVFCIPAGSTVELSMSGSDGYSDSETYTITEASNNVIFTLQVPGAEAGIKDVITVKITTPNGQTIFKQTSLIFS